MSSFEVSPDFQMAGQVKWFSLSRGYGFVHDEQSGEEILLHANVLKDFGRSSVLAGSRIEFEAVQTERGYQARKILAIYPCEDSAEETTSISNPSATSDEYVAARVKWFDVEKGFGFVNAFGKPNDHFIHASVLHQMGLETVGIGEAICVRLGKNENGSAVLEVKPWAIHG
jgi:CspA family cold shock protein